MHQIRQFDENCTYILNFLDYISINDNTGVIENILQYALRFKKAFKIFSQKDRLDIFLRGIFINGKCDILGQQLKNINESQLKQYYHPSAYFLIDQYKQQVADLLISFGSTVFNCNQYQDKGLQIQKVSYFNEKNQEYQEQHKDQIQEQEKEQQQIIETQEQNDKSLSIQQSPKQQISQQNQQEQDLLLSDILNNDDIDMFTLQSTQSQIQSSVLLDQTKNPECKNGYIKHKQTTQNFDSVLYQNIEYQQYYFRPNINIQRQISQYDINQQVLNSTIIQEQNLHISIPLDQYLYVIDREQYFIPMTKNISYNDLLQLLDDRRYNKQNDYNCAICGKELSIYKQITLPNQILQSETYIKVHVCEKCYQFYLKLYQLPCMLTVICPNLTLSDVYIRKMLYFSKKLVLWQKLYGKQFDNLNSQDNEITINDQRFQLKWEVKHLVEIDDIKFKTSEKTGNIIPINYPYISFNDLQYAQQYMSQLESLCNQIYKKDKVFVLKQQFLCNCGKTINLMDPQTFICFNCGCVQHYQCKHQNSKGKCFVCNDFKF